MFDRFYRSADGAHRAGLGPRARDRAADRRAPRRHGLGRRTAPEVAPRSASSSRRPAASTHWRPEPRPVLTERSSDGSNGRMRLRHLHGPVPPGRAEPDARARARPRADRSTSTASASTRRGSASTTPAGYEIIASPEVFIGVAAERTKHIKLGTGVSSLPYHHPLMLADRMVLLDHLTRGRAMLGCRPRPAHVRRAHARHPRRRAAAAHGGGARRDHGAAARRDRHHARPTGSRCSDARLQLRPYSDPCFDIAVAASFSPTGARAAGKHGIGMLSIAATAKQGFDLLGHHWNDVGGGRARARPRRRPVEVAPRRPDAPRRRRGSRPRRTSSTASRSSRSTSRTCCPAGPVQGDNAEEIIDNNKAPGFAVIGTPDDAIAKIEELVEASNGGFGTFLLFGHDWADARRDAAVSFELFAQYVMPHFTGPARRAGRVVRLGHRQRRRVRRPRRATRSPRRSRTTRPSAAPTS